MFVLEKLMIIFLATLQRYSLQIINSMHRFLKLAATKFSNFCLVYAIKMRWQVVPANFVIFCNLSKFCHPSGSYATESFF